MLPLRLRGFLMLLLVGLTLYLCFLVLKPFLSVVVWSAVLAVLFMPLRDRLLARTRRRNLAAALTLLVAITSVLLPVTLIALSLASEVQDLVGEGPETVSRALAAQDLKARAAELLAAVQKRVPFLEGLDRRALGESVRELGRELAESSLDVAGKALQGGLRFVLTAFALFFLLRDGEAFSEQVRGLLPLSRRQADQLLDRVAEVLRASTYGIVVVAVIQGILGGGMFSVLGLPSPVLWGVVMTLFAMIPMVGAGIVWLPAVVLLLFAGETTKALVLAGWGALVVGTIDNVLRPRLVGQRAHLHELVVFFGVLGGLRAFGLVGVLVGPLVFALAEAMLALTREKGALQDSGSADSEPGTL